MAKSQLPSCIILPISSDTLHDVVNTAKDYALMNGLTLHSNSPFNRNYVKLSRFVLLPTSFPKEEFDKAKILQMTLNKLTHNVAYDHEFLCETLKNTIEADDFTDRLFQIYQNVYREGFAQPLSLGMLRSDYMLNSALEIKQVELNTIASSFGGLAPIVSNLQRFILAELEHADKASNIPANNSCTGLAEGLIEAWKQYNNAESVILFVVEDQTCNICDHRALEFHIRATNPQIRVIRRTFSELPTLAQLRPNKELFVGELLVSVVYYRTGYQVSAYTSEDIWSLRLLIERSRAIKCPSIQYQLAGLKKIQQELTRPQVLKRFLTHDESKKVRGLFTGLYSLDFDEDGEAAVEMAIAQPEKFVLKPQREGGGNNVYGRDIKIILEQMKNSKERNGYILMEYIDTPVQENYLLEPDDEKPCLRELISELGIYGVIIGDENNIRINREVGHVLRTKPFGENEGGIISGAGALDSPYLTVLKK